MGRSVLFCLFIICSSSFSKPWGFEIGNSWKLITNEIGKYSLGVPEKWEAGFAGRLTEIIAPLSEGTPRMKIQVNVVEDGSIIESRDLVKEGWETTHVGALDGAKREYALPSGTLWLEVRLFLRSGKYVSINGESPTSTSPDRKDELKKAIGSFIVN